MHKWILVEWNNSSGRIVVEENDLLNVCGSLGVGSRVDVMYSHELRSATVVAVSDDLDELERAPIPKIFPIAAPLRVWEKHERTNPQRFSPNNYACYVDNDDEDEVGENYGEASQISGVVETKNTSIHPELSDEIDITSHQPIQYNSVDSEVEPMELDAAFINVHQTEKNNLKTDLLKIKNKMTEEKKYLDEIKEDHQRITSPPTRNLKIATFHTRDSPRSVWEKLAKNTIAKRPPAGFSASDDSSDDNNCNGDNSYDERGNNEKVKAGQIKECVKSKNTSKTSQLSIKAHYKHSTAHLSVQTDNVESDDEPMELEAPVLKMKLLKINLTNIRNGIAEAKELLDEIKKDKKRITGTDPTINPKTPHNRTEPANIPEKIKPLNMDPLVKFIQKLSHNNEHKHINISKTSTCTFTSQTISESESVTLSPMGSNSTGQSSIFGSAVNPNMLPASSRLSLNHPIASTSKIDQISSRLRTRTTSASTSSSSCTVTYESDRYSDNVLITNKYDKVNNDRLSSTTIESDYSDNVLISNKYDTINNRHSSISSFSSDTNVVRIGTGCTTISKDDFDRIDWQNCGTATRSLLTCLFSRRVLATHSLSGKQSPAFPDRRPKKPLDSRIVMDIIAEVMSRYRVKENYVRNIIRNKCSDENKALRKEKDRTSRDSGSGKGGVSIRPSQPPNQKEAQEAHEAQEAQEVQEANSRLPPAALGEEE